MRGLSYALLERGGELGDPTRSKEEGLHPGKGGAAGGGRALPLAEGLWLPDSGGTLSCRLLQTKQSGSAAAYTGALGNVQISSLIETRSQAGVVLASLSLPPIPGLHSPSWKSPGESTMPPSIKTPLC